MAISMPRRARSVLSFLIENRTQILGVSLILVTSSVFAADSNDHSSDRTLVILESNFKGKPENVQKTLMRNIALLQDVKAVPFFVEVALDPSYTEDVRRESLKGLLTLDSQKYRFALEALQTSPLQDDRIIRNLQLMEDVDLLKPFLDSLTFKEEKRIMDMKVSAVLRFWNEETIEAYDFSRWPSDEASQELSDLVFTTPDVTQKVRLIKLWGTVRNEKTTKEMVKLLDNRDEKVQEATIFALAEPGSSGVNALGRFLQKSKNPTLRKRAIFALRKISSETAKAALKAYLPQAKSDEKKWIQEILR